MQFTFEESVRLIDTYTDKMMQNIENPLRYQLRVALYNLSNHSPSEEKLQEAWDDGFEQGEQSGREDDTSEAYDEGWDAAMAEISRAQ